EKMVAWGGNSALCGALMCMPLTKMQKQKGIKDSVDLMVKDMKAAGRGFNHEELTRTFANNAAGAFDMLIECGVELQDKVIRLGGHSAPRAHLPKVPSGGSITVPMHKWLEARGVVFRNRCNVNELVCTDEGAKGVCVCTNYDWHDESFDRIVSLRARAGVVIATGGWGQDKAFVKATMPAYSALECTSQPGSTATMIRALLKAGALPVMLDMFQLGPWATPDEKGAGPGSFFADYAFAEGMAIDPKTGKRFMNELADRRTRAEAQLKVLAKGTKEAPNYPFCFCGEATTKRAEGFKAAYREGTVKKSNTVEDLARLHHVDVAALKASIAEWNRIVAGKQEDPFKKPLDVRTELKAPFYSMRLSPKLHYCMGGAAISTRAEVISAQTCGPIPGLYAAGEVTGGVHGMDRLGGCSSVDCFVFGQIAGAEVAARMKSAM
ncbi:MAG: flavocytochrome c, partial [Duodenibacillus sp.]